MRLYTSIPGSILFTAGLFLYSWSSQPSIHWIVPTIGVCIVGVGIYSIYIGVVNYLTDAYEKFAASALSAASLGRNAFGAFLRLASYSLFETIGYGWAGSLLEFLAAALTLVPIILLFKGPEIRASSPFMLESTFSAEEGQQRRESSTAGGRGSVTMVQDLGRASIVGSTASAGGPQGAAEGALLQMS